MLSNCQAGGHPYARIREAGSQSRLFRSPSPHRTDPLLLRMFARQCVLYACELRTFRFAYGRHLLGQASCSNFAFSATRKKKLTKAELQSRVGFFLSLDQKNIFLNFDVFVLFDFLVDFEFYFFDCIRLGFSDRQCVFDSVLGSYYL